MKQKFDVFLSRKTEDAHLADTVYQYVTEKGLKVFDERHSLKDIGNSAYSEVIDETLEGTSHLIVIGSSAENIRSKWVMSEWTSFLNLQRSGKTKGNILTLVTRNVSMEDLPLQLRNYQIFYFENGLESILPYVNKNNQEEKTADPTEISPKKQYDLNFEENKIFKYLLRFIRSAIMPFIDNLLTFLVLFVFALLVYNLQINDSLDTAIMIPISFTLKLYWSTLNYFHDIRILIQIVLIATLAVSLLVIYLFNDLKTKGNLSYSPTIVSIIILTFFAGFGYGISMAPSILNFQKHRYEKY
jgi:hypothetical protein